MAGSSDSEEGCGSSWFVIGMISSFYYQPGEVLVVQVWRPPGDSLRSFKAPISTSSCGNRRLKSIGKYPMTPRGIETGIGALSSQIRTALFYMDMAPDPSGSLASVP